MELETPHFQILFQFKVSILHTAVPQTRAKLGRNALFLPDFQFRFNLTVLQQNSPLTPFRTLQMQSFKGEV